MAVQVYVPGQLRQVFGSGRWEEVQAGDLLGLIRELDARYPGLAERLTEPDPAHERGLRLRRWVLVFVDGHNLTDLAAPLPVGGQVRIVPSVAGG